MLTYSKIDHIKFKEYLEIKDEPWNIENILVKKTRKYTKFIKNIPWIKMVAIWNSVAMNYATKESDIDLFIITSKNRLWLVRVLTTLIFSALWLRKTSKNHAWKFCLSFFVTTDWMNLWDFAIENDIYLYFWMIYLKPIINYNNAYENFINLNRSWADFTEFEDIIENNKWFVKYEWNSIWDWLKTLDFIDKILKFLLQSRAIKKYEQLWKPYWIVIWKNILKFHDDDKRVEFREKILANEE